jgi:hypothetical protein
MLLGIVIAAWVQVGIESSLIPARGEICEQDQQTKQKHCTTNHIALVAIWHLGELIENHEGAITAIGTLFIGAFTATLWWSTRRLWDEARIARRLALRSVRIAKQSADAAMRGVAASVNIALPILQAEAPNGLIGLDETGGRKGVDIPGKRSEITGIGLRNYGRTPAFPIALGLGWKVAETLTGEPAYPYSLYLGEYYPFRPEAEIASEAERPRHSGIHIWCPNFVIELGEHEIASLRAETSWLWLYGFISYIDFMGEERKDRFCWRRTKSTRSKETQWYFSTEGEPPKSYTRRD